MLRDNNDNNNDSERLANTGFASAKNLWRTIEDGCLADNLQNKEYQTHYDRNRCERQLVGTDTKLSIKEQKIEDKFAAEFWEQVRLDQEKEDEKLAKELQNRLIFEANKLQKLQNDTLLDSDVKLAKKLQAKEIYEKQNRKPCEGTVQNSSLNSSNILCRQKHNSLSQNKDCHLQQEQKDYELAKYLQKQERLHPSQKLATNHDTKNDGTTRLIANVQLDSGTQRQITDVPPRPKFSVKKFRYHE